ncbi:PsbP-related protein [Deinococcus navajonensis]|uniref:PsbP-related protein n=1 Tax=Deinococcus navajonensis TaxID=309884 RepID=A0ABV8XRD5_9DEIO
MMRSALLAALVLSGWSAAAPYTDAKNGFSVTPPAGWQKGSYPGTALVYLSPKPVKEFTPNVNVVVQALPKGMTQAQYHQLSTSQIAKVITEGRILSNRATTLGGQPANELVYTGRQGQYLLSFLATYAVRGGQAYIVTFTTVKGQEAAIKPMAAAFVKSFRFTR